MARPKTLKPYRVSYYFLDSADKGRVRLWTRIVRAFDRSGAGAVVQNIYAGAPGNLIIHKAYHFYRTWKKANRSTYIRVAPVTFVGSTTSGAQSFSASITIGPVSTPAPISSTFDPSPWLAVTPFKGEIAPRPAGKCTMHPDAVLEADGRCPALDPGYIPGQKPKFIPDRLAHLPVPDLAAIVAKVKGKTPGEVFPGLENVGYTPVADLPADTNVRNTSPAYYDSGHPDQPIEELLSQPIIEPPLRPVVVEDEDPNWQPYSRIDAVTVGLRAEREDQNEKKIEIGCNDPSCDWCKDEGVGAASERRDYKSLGGYLGLALALLCFGGLGYLLLKGFHIIH